MESGEWMRAAVYFLLVLLVMTVVGGGIEPSNYQGPFAWPPW